ncbi:hypothetical protein PRIC1_014931 [Phytophthora ramorum]
MSHIMSLVKALMKLNNAAKLGCAILRRTILRPVLRQATIWLSTYEMAKRFFKIKAFIDTTNAELAVLMPTPLEEVRPTSAMKELKQCEHVSKKLQSENG